MLRVLALAASAQAVTWSGTNVNVTTSWATEDQNGGAHTNAPRSAGALVSFDSPAGSIANGTGSCTVTVSNVAVNFAHFFDAHVGSSGASGVFTLSAHGEHQDQGSYSRVDNRKKREIAKNRKNRKKIVKSRKNRKMSQFNRKKS